MNKEIIEPMRITLVAILSMIALCGSAQESFPKDVDFEGLKGFPMQICEIITTPELQHKIKEVYHFDQKGYLQSIEHYNVHDTDKDSLLLGDVTHYVWPEAQSKLGITIHHESQDTVRVKTYTLVDPFTIDISIREEKNDFASEIRQNLDETNRIIKTSSKITDITNDAIKVISTTSFVYHKGTLSQLVIQDDHAGSESKRVHVADEKRDEHGNFVYREFIDENNSTVYVVNRKYIYH